ncbi:MAG: hypothetical protein QG630_289 [Patescibacteria group bacterium]|nr:hypothetical protein [Patescibacteria group bacterium]
MSKNTVQLTFPNKEVKNLWPEIEKQIISEVKDPSISDIPFEKKVREILKKELGAELIRTDDGYKKFFYEAIRFAVNMDTDKILNRIAGGRSRYGEARHAKGKIVPKTELLKEERDE